MIWTEEEDSKRQLENLLNRKGKSCANCHWSSGAKDEVIITCGHHIQNFTSDSFCAYWTKTDDKKLQEHYAKIKARIEKKKAEKYETMPCPQCQGGGCRFCSGFGVMPI